MLEIDSVSKRFGSQVALNDVSVTLNKGDFKFIMGHSGSGKSTLLKLIYGAVKPTSGSVSLFGSNVASLSPNKVASLRRKLGIVFQDYKLIKNKTVWENIAFALEVQGAKNNYIKKKVSEALGFVDLSLRSRDYPNMLSGGEQQRVGIARALVNNPQLLLADEPTGNLDDANSDMILDILSEINNMGTTLLIATHDSRLVTKSMKKALKLDHGQMEGYNHAE